MGLIIDALIAFFMEAILKLLLKGSLMIAQLILDKSITSFQNGSNIIMAAMGLLNLEEIELGELFIGIGKGLILTLFLLQLITELAKATVGEQAQQPLQIIGRCVLSYLLLIIIFGSSLFKNNTILGGGLLKLLGEFGANILSKINVDIAPPDKLGDWIGIDLLKPAEQFGLLIMYAALMGSVLGATISYVERVISLALSAIMGPLCISLYSVKELQHYAKGWLVNIMVQIACIFVSLCMWSLFLQRLDFTADSVFELAILVVVLNLMKDSEQIFKSLGFQTMPNIDTAKAMMGGFANTLTTFKNVRALAGFPYNAITKGIPMAKSLIKYRNEQTVLASAINESSVEDKSHFSTIWNGHRDVVVGNKSATVFSVTSQSNAGKKFYVLPQNDEDTFSHGETFRYKNSQMVINGKTQKFKNRTCYEAEKYNLKERFGKNDSHT